MATTNLCALMGLPDELLVYIIDGTVQADKPITLHGSRKGYIARSSSQVRTLIRPFRVCKRLWRIATSQVYRVNSFSQMSDISLEGCSPGVFLKYVADAQQARHVVLRLSQLNVNDPRLSSGLEAYGQVNLDKFTNNYPIKKSLTIDVRHDAGGIQMPFYYHLTNGTVVEQEAGSAKNIAGQLRAILDTVHEFAPRLKGVEVYVRLTQILHGPEYATFEVDGRKISRVAVAWDMLDYAKCRVRLA
ncbi:hypothetical protein LTR27_006181 [Elasticomyces elasticus]|nr:hypothetical protein LTR27_006181 [Elasticomyces elasticus]